MIETIRSLFEHQEWADTKLLSAVSSHEPAALDPQMRWTLHHIAGVQRVFLAIVHGREVDAEAMKRVPETLAGIESLFQATHREWKDFVAGLTVEELSRRVTLPRFGDFPLNVEQVLLQVVMHSQNHRGQCLTRLRELGATPPTLDFILWVKERQIG